MGSQKGARFAPIRAGEMDVLEVYYRRLDASEIEHLQHLEIVTFGINLEEVAFLDAMLLEQAHDRYRRHRDLLDERFDVLAMRFRLGLSIFPLPCDASR